MVPFIPSYHHFHTRWYPGGSLPVLRTPPRHPQHQERLNYRVLKPAWEGSVQGPKGITAGGTESTPGSGFDLNQQLARKMHPFVGDGSVLRQMPRFSDRPQCEFRYHGAGIDQERRAMDEETIIGLGNYLNLYIDPNGTCDRSFRNSTDWLRANGRDVEAEIKWLKEQDVHCDCEFVIKLFMPIRLKLR